MDTVCLVCVVFYLITVSGTNSCVIFKCFTFRCLIIDVWCVLVLDSLGLHRVENDSHTEGSVSLHLYSPPFDTCQTFDERTGHKNTVKMTFWSKFGERTPFVRLLSEIDQTQNHRCIAYHSHIITCSSDCNFGLLSVNTLDIIANR